MLSFIFRRFLSAIPTLFIIVTISFFLIRLAPGGPGPASGFRWSTPAGRVGREGRGSVPRVP